MDVNRNMIFAHRLLCNHAAVEPILRAPTALALAILSRPTFSAAPRFKTASPGASIAGTVSARPSPGRVRGQPPRRLEAWQRALAGRPEARSVALADSRPCLDRRRGIG